MFEPTFESLKQHRVPAWYEDAKFGIFIHWTPSSVPAYAPVTDIQSLVKEQGASTLFSHSPYSEWYLNSLRISGSPVQRHHLETYGADYPYERFGETFRQQVRQWDPVRWADLFAEACARYVVFVTKHHDGFLLWPSSTRHPQKSDWHSERNLVGELTEAVRARGMKMGYYYSGALDWSFTEQPVTSFTELMTSGPASQAYADYVDAHYRELIDTWAPEILWNDIAYPGKARLEKLIADYYNRIPEGVINDRWFEVTTTVRLMARFPGIARLLDRQASRMFERGMPRMDRVLSDYSTPEYRTLKAISPHKWECVRGIGSSFGYNRQEPDSNFLSGAELVRMLADIVAKNGNLLLNVGPMPDGHIPEVQDNSLRELGAWLKRYGEAIFDTRPWHRFDVPNDEQVEIRVTQNQHHLYLILCSNPPAPDLHLTDLHARNPVWLATGAPLDCVITDSGSTIKLPQQAAEWTAEVIRLEK